MSDAEHRALCQGFLPTDRAARAYVWKYSQVIGGRRPRHFHAEPEVNVVVRGWGVFGLGDRTVRVSAGELLAFPPGQDHVLLEASSDLYLYAIGLDPSYSTDVSRADGATFLPLHVRLPPRELQPVLDRAGDLVDRTGADTHTAELWERAQWLGARADQIGGRGTHVLTRRALQALWTAPELGLEALSRELRAPSSEISRHFHRDVGATLVRYRTRLRMLHVIRLMDTGEHDLMTAASIAGFGSYSQCHRTFHAELGCAPRQFFASVRAQMQLAYTP